MTQGGHTGRGEETGGTVITGDEKGVERKGKGKGQTKGNECTLTSMKLYCLVTDTGTRV